MSVFLTIIGVIGLILIYRRVAKRVQKNERVKVSPELLKNSEAAENSAAKAAKSFKKAMSWKRKAVDYKLLNQTFNAADYHYSRGEFAEAEKGFIKVIALKDDHPESNNKLGIIYMKQNQHKKAEAIYRMLTETYPDRALYFSNLGRALYNQENLKEAATAYERSVQLNTERVERYLSLGQVYRELNEFKNAVRAFSKALEQDQRNEDLFFLIADLLEQLEAFDEAVAYMEAMLDEFPYNDEAKKRLRDYRRRAKINPLSTGQAKKGSKKTTKKSKAQKQLLNEAEAGDNISQKASDSENDNTTTDTKNPEPIVASPDQLKISNMAFEEEAS